MACSLCTNWGISTVWKNLKKRGLVIEDRENQEYHGFVTPYPSAGWCSQKKIDLKEFS